MKELDGFIVSRAVDDGRSGEMRASRSLVARCTVALLPTVNISEQSMDHATGEQDAVELIGDRCRMNQTDSREFTHSICYNCCFARLRMKSSTEPCVE
jgi:hypothetical protein